MNIDDTRLLEYGYDPPERYHDDDAEADDCGNEDTDDET